ncbi:MAG: hypothetical protein QME74_02050 [Candidatus Edwardsbacteria bacterium]|nr:hypothetical protein [Candidatus Edwardsbacteria bacterium]
MGYSFPLGIPLVLYPILLIVAWNGRHSWWGWIGHGLFLLCVGYFLVIAVRKSEYEKIHEQRPELNRLTWVMNYLLFFVLVPLAVWVPLLLAALQSR